MQTQKLQESVQTTGLTNESQLFACYSISITVHSVTLFNEHAGNEFASSLRTPNDQCVREKIDRSDCVNVSQFYVHLNNCDVMYEFVVMVSGLKRLFVLYISKCFGPSYKSFDTLALHPCCLVDLASTNFTMAFLNCLLLIVY